MRPIWYFVGLILSIMGFIILVTGIYMFAANTETKSVLSDLHPNIWWGAIMVVVGGIYVIKNKNVRIE